MLFQLAVPYQIKRFNQFLNADQQTNIVHFKLYLLLTQDKDKFSMFYLYCSRVFFSDELKALNIFKLVFISKRHIFSSVSMYLASKFLDFNKLYSPLVCRPI